MTTTDLQLTRESAAAILGSEPGKISNVELFRTQNHTWRVTSGDSICYVKAHTKDWYRSAPGSSVPVRHEVTGHGLLRTAGLPAAEVINYSTSADNALGWPYLITRRLPGKPLIDLLPLLDRDESDRAMTAVGSYLAKMHSLTYQHPGYLVDGPPPRPEPNDWLHWLCRMERFLLYFCASISTHATEVDLATNDAAVGLLHRTLPQLREAYLPLRFVHGDCHASVFFLTDNEKSWQVSGVVDLENCSAGAPAFDFVKLLIELAGHFGTKINWWQPLFEAYGVEPDFDLIRLLLIGHAHINYTCLGIHSWPGNRGDILNHILTAHSWAELFDIRQDS